MCFCLQGRTWSRFFGTTLRSKKSRSKAGVASFRGKVFFILVLFCNSHFIKTSMKLKLTSAHSEAKVVIVRGIVTREKKTKKRNLQQSVLNQNCQISSYCTISAGGLGVNLKISNIPRDTLFSSW